MTKWFCCPVKCLLLITLLSGCFYTPTQQPLPNTGSIGKSNNFGSSGTGTLFSINIGQQTCNPSVSQNPLYKGCMLWLGFDKLTVRVPEQIKSDFGLTTIKTHDRLTISDTSNTVRWFIFRSDIDTRGELQCPEWSAHPNYLVCLTGVMTLPFNGYIIRISDKQSIQFSSKNLEEFSTPHAWISSSAPEGSSAFEVLFDSSGFATKESITLFFGTDQVKIVYTLPQKLGTLYYIDYSVSSTPVALRKPVSKEIWKCASPLISPDGNWVTYHCYQNITQGPSFSSFIQRLKPNSEPILIAEAASDPHWWIDTYNNNTYYVVYTNTKGQYFIESDFTDTKLEESGITGATLKQKLRGTWKDVPSHITSLDIDRTVLPDTLVNLPFKGGLSTDGFYLATAYKYAYLLKLQ